SLRDCRVLGPDELRLSLDEAKEIAPGALSAEQVEALWREADGRFTPFSASSYSATGLPRLHVPSAAGPLVASEEAVLVDPAPAIVALQREGDLIGALELAVLKAPELVEDLLRTAGPRYQEEGLLERLHLLLSALPESYSRSDRVLEWRLVAGVAANDYQEAFEDADAYLRTHAA